MLVGAFTIVFYSIPKCIFKINSNNYMKFSTVLHRILEDRAANISMSYLNTIRKFSLMFIKHDVTLDTGNYVFLQPTKWILFRFIKHSNMLKTVMQFIKCMQRKGEKWFSLVQLFFWFSFYLCVQKE